MGFTVLKNIQASSAKAVRGFGTPFLNGLDNVYIDWCWFHMEGWFTKEAPFEP